jgi:hypothetical protein
MIKVYLDNNYPKNLAEALQLVHRIQIPHQFNVVRTQSFEEVEAVRQIVFLFDRSKKGIDIVTEKHYELGYRVFAFKLSSTDQIDLFQLSLVTLKLWPKILSTIYETPDPFVVTYNYQGKNLTKVKGA